MTLHQVARGRELAGAVIARVMRHAALVERMLGRRAALAIVAASDVQSRRFVQIKQQLLAHVKIEIAPVWLDSGATTADALAVIDGLNARDDLEAIFLQFPLPAAIDPQTVADAIVPDKDVDCSGAAAEAQLEAGATDFAPVAPRAACMLLEDALHSRDGRSIGIYGANDAFARALRTMLLRKHADVRVIAPETGTHDVAGMDALVFSEMVPPPEVLFAATSASVLLDAGYYLPPRPAHWLPDGLRARNIVLLKQYGNVGPLTVANLARATVRAGRRRVNLSADHRLA